MLIVEPSKWAGVPQMQVKVYISKHCVSCLEVVSYFEEKGIDFEKIDVTHDREGFDEMFKLGGIATPLIVIGNTVMHSFDRSRIAQMLEVFNR